MFQNTTTRNIAELGEFGLIKHLTQNITTTQPNTLKGIGDDAAVIDLGNGKVQLISTDTLAEGIHFDLSYVPLKHLGYKAIAVNLSDIYAMNGIPTHITVALAMSSKYTVDALEELYEGMLLACKQYNIDFIGGDTTASKSGLVINVTAIGTVDKEKVAYRSGAKENDLICVSGDLGAAYLGLQILEREKNVYLQNPEVQPALEGYDYLLERQLKPEPRKDIIKWLDDNNIQPTSMIDISDGLASELHHICTQSNVGCAIYEEKLPIDTVSQNTALELKLDTTTCALNGGEDYELLFTISQADYDKITANKNISVIGYTKDKNFGIQLETKAQNQIKIVAQGWQHFAD